MSKKDDTDVLLWAVRCPDGMFRHGYHKYTSSGKSNAMIDCHDFTVAVQLCNLRRVIASACGGGTHVVELVSYPERDVPKLRFDS